MEVKQIFELSKWLRISMARVLISWNLYYRYVQGFFELSN